MTDDEKKQVTSLPPPTDDLDKDWSRPSGAPPEPKEKRPAETSAKKSATDPKSDLTPPWKKAKPAKDEHDEDDDDDDDDDDDIEDEDEDDDDDEEERRKARARAAKTRERQSSSERKPEQASPSDDWIPDWVPWAVLGGLLLLGFLGGFGLLPFNFNLKPAPAPEASAAPVASDTTKARPSSSALREQARERRRRAMAAAADGGAADSTQIRASHLLVAYSGATRSSQTRTKEEAKARAEEALKRAKKGEDFAKVVASYTDEPGGAERGGDLNKFGRGRMVPAFEEAAFALKVNEISGLVETPFGFHVIKRTE